MERCLALFVYGYYISVITRIDYSNNCVLNERCDDVSPVYRRCLFHFFCLSVCVVPSFFMFFVVFEKSVVVCDITNIMFFAAKEKSTHTTLLYLKSYARALSLTDK